MSLEPAIAKRPPRVPLLLCVLLLLFGALMLDSARRIRKHRREVAARVYSQDRFVDASVTLRVVVADAVNGEHLLGPNLPKVRALREHQLGGVIDTHAKPPRIDPDRERKPVIWYCSEDQEPVILHGDGEPLGLLVYGSEGAGKTAALVMWLYCRWMEFLGQHGAQIGCSAPTDKRVRVVLDELRKWWPTTGRPKRNKPPELRWGVYRASDGIMRMVDGTLIRFGSTYQQSAAQGSRWQGFNLWACASDEFQDSLNDADNITARGRAAPKGRYKRLCTATAKDDPIWRSFRDQLLQAIDAITNKTLWQVRKLLADRSPFVDPSFWARMRASLSPREARRRLGAEDLPPERATYPTWDRKGNLVVIPDIGWTDVTAIELAPYALNATVLGGHDPGSLCDVTLLLKAFVRSYEAYRRGLEMPMWIVVDEITTEGTKDVHVKAVLEVVRRRWKCNLLDRHNRLVDGGSRLFVRCDPAGEAEDKPDQSVYTIWRQYGVDIAPALWSKANPTRHGKLDKNAGINLVATLLCNADGLRRLFVACTVDDRGISVECAPKLVYALETSERDLAGKAERQLKRKGDVSHWPAALRYALWLLEKPRLPFIERRTS